jgi:hypothetical protein
MTLDMMTSDIKMFILLLYQIVILLYRGDFWVDL